MRKLAFGVAIGVALFATERGKKARQVYAQEVSAGARPIQAVGTAVAAFIGYAPKTTP